MSRCCRQGRPHRLAVAVTALALATSAHASPVSCVDTLACRSVAAEARLLAEQGKLEESVQRFDGAYRAYGDFWLLHSAANGYYELSKQQSNVKNRILYLNESRSRFKELLLLPHTSEEALQDAQQALLTIQSTLAHLLIEQVPSPSPTNDTVKPRRWRLWLAMTGAAATVGLAIGLGVGLDRLRHSQDVSNIPTYH